MKNVDTPIYPTKVYLQTVIDGIPKPSTETNCLGLTKREHFAGLAMQAILSASQTADNGF